MPGFSSTSTLAILSSPSFSPAISSRTGAIILQGPHQVAQKSTSTGVSDCKTSVSKVRSETVKGLIPMNSSVGADWASILESFYHGHGERQAARRLDPAI